MKIRNGFVSNSSSSSFLVVGKVMEKEEFDSDKDRILEFLKEHPKLDIFYTNDTGNDWSLGLEPDFGEAEYNRIFRWSNSIIVGIEYKAGGITSLNNITVELAELFGVYPEDLGIHFWGYYEG